MSKTEGKTIRIAEKIQSGEYSVEDDANMIFKLLLNAHGSDIEEQRNEILDTIEMATNKTTIDGREYMAVEDVINIIKNA